MALLPKLNTPEWAAEVNFYLASAKQQRDKRAVELGYAGRASYETRMAERGVHLHGKGGRKSKPPTPQIQTIPALPDLKIKPFRVGKVQRDEEDIGLVLSDHHAGKETSSYNLAIYKARMHSLLDSVMSIINLHRPVRRVYVFMLGDMVQGESVHQGSHIEQCRVGAYGQVYEYAIPTLRDFLVSLSQGVERVDWYGIRGNHGRYERTGVPRTNWDNFVYAGLNDQLANQKHIQGHISTDFYQLATIRGFRFFLVHGDQVSARMGVPLFALRRKYQEWYAYVGGFQYAYNGHFHVGGADHINSLAQYAMCPPMVTGDDWALEIIGRASSPVQLIFGVHTRYGRTFEYSLYCDKQFLPQPFMEVKL